MATRMLYIWKIHQTSHIDRIIFENATTMLYFVEYGNNGALHNKFNGPFTSAANHQDTLGGRLDLICGAGLARAEFASRKCCWGNLKLAIWIRPLWGNNRPRWHAWRGRPGCVSRRVGWGNLKKKTCWGKPIVHLPQQLLASKIWVWFMAHLLG